MDTTSALGQSTEDIDTRAQDTPSLVPIKVFISVTWWTPTQERLLTDFNKL